MLSVLAATLLLASPDGGVSAADNLVTLARAWEQVRLFHPFLYEREIDWDQAWIKAAPRAEAARTPEALHAVIAQMLATLKDPVTRLRPSALPNESKPGPMLEFKGTVPVVNVWTQEFADASESMESMKKLGDALENQPRVVFDLRGTSDLWVSLDDLHVPGFGPSKNAPAPGLRGLVHHGYAATGGSGSSGYSTVFEETLPVTVKKNAPSPRRYAFVINPDDTLPTIALAMQRVGEAFIVATAPTDDRVAVTSIDIELGGKMKATIRTRSLVPPRGFAVDLVIPAGKAPIDAAVALINGKQQVKAAPLLPATPPHHFLDATYAETPYPSRALRQLAGVRVWMIARRFWAYPHLTTEDYDAVLAGFLPRLAAATDEVDYSLILAELSTHLPDGHTGLFSKTLNKRLGEITAPLEVRVIEQQFLVWKVLPEAQKAGVQRGDLLLEIDGLPVAVREAFLRKYITASHPEALRSKLAWYLLSGDEGSRVKLKLKKADGSIKIVELERKAEGLDALFASAPPPHYRVLEGNLGYIDLSELELTEVDAAMQAVQGTRALIFDDRGYPKGTAFKLGPMLDVKHPRGLAQFFEPLVTASSDMTGQTLFFLQTLPPARSSVYSQPTVMLIDDQAMSQSEHSGLIFEAYAGTTFIGSPTAGANGDVTSAMLPGGIKFNFTGHDVRHADGRQLQRIGLVPDVLVRPTISGIRAGRDEVLEAATAYLKKKGLAPPDAGR